MSFFLDRCVLYVKPISSDLSMSKDIYFLFGWNKSQFSQGTSTQQNEDGISLDKAMLNVMQFIMCISPCFKRCIYLLLVLDKFLIMEFIKKYRFRSNLFRVFLAIN